MGNEEDQNAETYEYGNDADQSSDYEFPESHVAGNPSPRNILSLRSPCAIKHCPGL